MNEDENVEETEPLDSRAERLMRIANTLVRDWPRFLPLLKQDAAGRALHAFKAELRSRAFAEFCQDYSDKRLCGENGPTVDYYFGGTVVQIALDLRSSDGEFERGVLKAIMAQGEGHPVMRLLFLGKTGARARCNSPFRSALVAWVRMEHGLDVEVREFGPAAEGIFDADSE